MIKFIQIYTKKKKKINGIRFKSVWTFEAISMEFNFKSESLSDI